MRRLWRRIRHTLKKQPWLSGLLASFVAAFLRFINFTNPQLATSEITRQTILKNGPAIIALWHGQHLMASFAAPKGMNFVALFSRSSDAELNARIAEKLGIEVVRGSGGRGSAHDVEKGGAQALIRLKRALDQGKSVVMIADISKSTAREAGAGIVLLSKISGRPILPSAYATSRGVTVKKSWDKMRINLPFGRAVSVSGEPLQVTADADEAAMLKARQELTARLNEATHQAYAMVGGAA
jgi:lysophospholipid acyltransferase (LPLAT)-like uncharacterized protein